MAEAEFMSAMLNVCRSRISDTDRIKSRCGGGSDRHHGGNHHHDSAGRSTVGQTRAEIDGLLCNGCRSSAQCRKADCLAEAINSGKGGSHR
jgi:hypothetical protein